MSSLPEEMYHEILLRLPVKSTLVCKCVCKNWYAIISNPSFVKTHHKLTIQKTNFSLLTSKFDISKSRNVICSISYDNLSISSNEFHLYGLEMDMPLGCSDFDIKLVGCCNGLVCIWNPQKELFGVWNPDSKAYKELPKSPSKPVDQIHNYLFTCGFGYDYNTCGYKLICLYNFFDHNFFDYSGTKVYVYKDVYMMESDSWKSTLVIPYDIDMDEYSGELANGSFHWLGKRFDNNFYGIISLDISNENFKEFQLPEEPFDNNNWAMNLGVLKECLCVLAHGDNVQVWVMQDYGVQESWTRHYIITHESLSYNWQLRPMWSFNSGEILFVCCNSFLEDLVLYDPKDGSARKPNMHAENKIFTLPKEIILGA